MSFLDKFESNKRVGNAYKLWNDEEDKKLIACYKKGLPIKQIQYELNRSAGAIESRLAKLLICIGEHDFDYAFCKNYDNIKLEDIT